MVGKYLMMVLGFSLLTGCGSFQPVESVTRETEKVGNWLEFGGTVYQVPDYYSTKQLDKSHQIDKTYYVKDLRCDDHVKRCTY